MQEFIFKILTAGDGGVGKTTLLHRYVNDIFSSGTKLTIGVEFFLKKLNIENTQCVLQVWDFGGQEQFRFLHDGYVAGAKGALLMFDLSRPLTLESLEEWIDICRIADRNLPIIFIGTKLDLAPNASENDDIALKYKKKFNLIEFIKTSSKTGENIDQAFEILTKEILNRRSKSQA